MNLISCNGCGVVLDKSKLNFPEDITRYDEDGSFLEVDQEKAEWSRNLDRFVAKIKCPVCSHSILEDE